MGYPCPSLPGRVFFEVSLWDNVARLCHSLPNVFPSKIFTESVPNPRTLLNLPDSYQPKHHGWVRLCRGIYKGDLAFIAYTSPFLLISVCVVPRFMYEKPQKHGVDEDSQDDEDNPDFALKYNPNRELLKRASVLGHPLQILFNPTIAKHWFQRVFQP